MKKRILEAMNEIYDNSFETFEEIFDFYTPNEAIDAYLEYNGFGNCTSELWNLYTTFYNMYLKTDKELFE